MTKAQEKAINKIRELVENQFYSDALEIKRWEVEENEHFVSLYVVYGMKNDEGTLGTIFRDHAHLFIGKRGGVTYPVHKTLKNGDFKCYTKRFNGYSIWQVVIDQR